MSEQIVIAPQPGPQTDFINAPTEIQIIYFGGGAGGGKVQPYTSKVVTPFGYKTLEECKVGDRIINPDGSTQKIRAVYPHKDWDFYKIKFADGAEIECGLEHLWVAWKASNENKKKTRLRKEKNLSGRASLFPDNAVVASTEELMDWMSRGYKPLIPVTTPVRYTVSYKHHTHLDAYILGSLLGDGTITTKDSIQLTRHIDDSEVDNYYYACGFEKTPKSPEDSFKFKRNEAFHQLIYDLNKLKLLGCDSHTKFIPIEYAFSSVERRTHLLQGLMDTDGYVSEDSKLYYTTVSKSLAEDVRELILSLGGLATVTSKMGSYRCQKTGKRVETSEAYTLYIRLPKGIVPFRLKRKLSRYKERQTRLYRRIVSIEYSRKADGCCISVDNPNRLYLTDSFVVTHNSHALLLDFLKYKDDPNFYAVYFRKTTKQLERTLWPAAKKLFMPFLMKKDSDGKNKFIGKANIQESKHIITFPSGAKAEFAYMELEKDAEYNWQGTEVSAVYWDETTHFFESQFNYLRSRLRSGAATPSFVRCSMNPDPDSWVKNWIDPFLDEDGYPIPELAGKVRYFIYYDGNLFTSWDEEELKFNFPTEVPLTYTFIPSLLTDNKIMLEQNPNYAATLAANTKAEKAALLSGCWKYVLDEGSYFNRDWLPRVDRVPEGAAYARAWDKASSVPTDVNKYPDYTASTKMAKDSNGIFYIVGDHHPEATDGDTGIYGKFRRLPGERDNIIQNQSKMDGDDCTVIFSRDPAQAGDVEFLESAKKLQTEGFTVRADPMPGNKSKLKRFEPFSAACMNGQVRIVPSTFKNQATLEAFLKELEQFVGQDATARVKVDWADSTASVFNFLAREQVVDTRGLGGALTKAISAPIGNKFKDISSILNIR